jgi:hypothetical protein
MTGTTWHDIAEQLTDEQIKLLERRDRDNPDALLAAAREMAAENLTGTVMFGHIAPPAGAVGVLGWQQSARGDYEREVEFATTVVAGVKVFEEGRQRSDGGVERYLSVYANDAGKLTSAQARELAAALLEAAGKIEENMR